MILLQNFWHNCTSFTHVPQGIIYHNNRYKHTLSVLYGLVQRPLLLILQLSISIHIYFYFLFLVRYKMMKTSRRASLIQWLHTYPMNHMLRYEILSHKKILSIVLEVSIYAKSFSILKRKRIRCFEILNMIGSKPIIIYWKVCRM